MLREGIEEDRHIYANASECRHDLAEITATQLIGWGIDDAFLIELVHPGVIVGAKPAQGFIPEALKRMYERGAYCTSCFGKTAYPAFGVHLVNALLLEDFPRSLT